MDRYITAPFDTETVKELHSGDYVYITGTVYTARDAAHKRMYEALEQNKELPFQIENNAIWALLRHVRGDRLGQQGRLQQAGWTSMPHLFWTWG